MSAFPFSSRVCSGTAVSSCAREFARDDLVEVAAIGKLCQGVLHRDVMEALVIALLDTVAGEELIGGAAHVDQIAVDENLLRDRVVVDECAVLGLEISCDDPLAESLHFAVAPAGTDVVDHDGVGRVPADHQDFILEGIDGAQSVAADHDEARAPAASHARRFAQRKLMGDRDTVDVPVVPFYLWLVFHHGDHPFVPDSFE